jgi:hypothetical protein
MGDDKGDVTLELLGRLGLEVNTLAAKAADPTTLIANTLLLSECKVLLTSFLSYPYMHLYNERDL